MTLPAVAEMVVRLEGIPLALELAAARMKSMTVSDINARLKDRFKLLTGGGNGPPRKAADAACPGRLVLCPLESSTSRRCSTRLSVFMGGFDLAAAEEVCGAEPIESLDVVDLLQSLVEKSLVMLDQREENTRYQVLETIRDYAHEKLEQDGETRGHRGAPLQPLFRTGQGGAGRPAG